MANAAATADKLKKLKQKREVPFNRVQESLQLAQQAENEPELRLILKFRTEDLESFKATFFDYHNQIIGLVDGDAFEAQDKVRVEFDNSYYTIKGINSRLNEPTRVIPPPSVTPMATANNNVKLPKITLPSFDGNYKSWPTFIDLFNKLIHENSSLAKIEKFQYLLTSLSKEPLNLVKTLPMTDNNYDVAYTTLVNRYQNTRLLATGYLNDILSAPHLKSSCHTQLRKLIDTFTENLAALHLLNFPVDHWSFIIFNLLLQKLDNSTRTAFEMKLSQTDIPTYPQLLAFLQTHCKALESMSYIPSKPIPSATPNKPYSNYTSRSTPAEAHPQRGLSSFVTNTPTSSAMSASEVCSLCRAPHLLNRCPQFLAKSTQDKFLFVKQHKLCINCLRSTHVVSSCGSSFSCRVCHARHHTLLHVSKNPAHNNPNHTPQNTVQQHPMNSKQFSNSNFAASNVKNSLQVSEMPSTARLDVATGPPNATAPVSSSGEVSRSPPHGSIGLNAYITALTSNAVSQLSSTLLATALINIIDNNGNSQTIRALIDSASQAHFITENCFRKLGLSRKKFSTPVFGLNNMSSLATRGISRCTLSPRNGEGPSFSIDVLVVSNICPKLPSKSIPSDAWPHLRTLVLADPKFDTPSSVDMVIGAELFPLLLKSGRILGEPGHAPSAIETSLGWILIGNISNSYDNPILSCCTPIGELPIDHIIQKFWEVEQISERLHISNDDRRCENIFKGNVSRNQTGRFIVPLPFREDHPDLGDTYGQALRRFSILESRFEKNSGFAFQYSEFMRDYLESGHMSLIDVNEPTPNHRYYIPHHAVFRPDSLTTKIRVVFDASSRGTKGISLNEAMFSGPKLQKDIRAILLQFRLHPFAFVADIRAMYRMILIHPSFRDYQRILWRFSKNEPVQEYRLNTVTYGLSSSPYLALRTLQELASIYEIQYPDAAEVLLNCTYVDDTICSVPTLSSALSLQENLIKLLKCGGFDLRKWASNCPAILSHVPDKDQQPIRFDLDEPSFVKVLGLQWTPQSDYFTYSCNFIERPCTKRNILSEISRIYDPLGFVSAVSVLAKILMQKLWLSKIQWDECPPPEIVDLWNTFRLELQELSRLQIPRCLLATQLQSCEIHAFSDASQSGYAAVVYFRMTYSSGLIKPFLIYAKSKVAPLKTLSIPRLELCAATLLVDILQFVTSTYCDKLKFDRIYAWTDSQVVLNWLHASPHTLKTFVANRVSHIQEILPFDSWHYVPSTCNPADCASRGLTPRELSNFSLWWNGPSWLLNDNSTWNFQSPSDSPYDPSDALLEQKLVSLTTTIQPSCVDTLLTNFSSFHKIKLILAYCFRFAANCKSKSRLSGVISRQELLHAQNFLVLHVQQQEFSDTIKRIESNKSLPKSLRKLALFVDAEGFLRVGGRLRHSNLDFDIKHPLLLPHSHRLTQLIIEDVHSTNLHPGYKTLHYLLMQQFWILSPRRAIEQCLSRCIRCFRARPRSQNPYMADLPSFRINQVKAFTHTAVDYAGPFTLSITRYRGARTFKAWICVFVCAATKAVHLEVSLSLSSDSFLAAFRRFVARRGFVSDLYSDCGTNFMGANSFLLKHSQEAAKVLHITWHPSPAGAPHFNALSEAGVKSVKTHMYRVVGAQILTYEEFNTLLIQIEALLNSRPLCAQSTDPNDLSPLTPGHFLTLSPLNSLPDPDVSHLKLNQLDRWQLVQQMHTHFWKRWHAEYLNTLQQRPKWVTHSKPISLHDLVLIKSETVPPLQWLLGRVITLHPGADGITRVVTLRTSKGVLKRPVVKICPLPNCQ